MHMLRTCVDHYIGHASLIREFNRWSPLHDASVKAAYSSYRLEYIRVIYRLEYIRVIQLQIAEKFINSSSSKDCFDVS